LNKLIPFVLPVVAPRSFTFESGTYARWSHFRRGP